MMRRSVLVAMAVLAVLAVLGVWGVAGVGAARAFSDEPASTRTPSPQAASTAIACNADEPGARLLIAGRVVDGADKPIAGAVVIAYNTDAAGLYNPRGVATRDPRIKATVTTDGAGRFQVLTVSPGPYPDSDDPAHVHFDVLAAGYRPTYSTIWFRGDPRITPVTTERVRAYAERNPHDTTTVVDVVQDERGIRLVRHDIVMEAN
jgi:protocatechuate 3,4-dioxygenase beta subunit